MSQPELAEVTRGENLYETFQVVDDDNEPRDLSTATLSVKAPSALFGMSLTAASTAVTGDIVLSSAKDLTLYAPIGSFTAEIWATWASGNPTDERLVSLFLVIKKAANE